MDADKEGKTLSAFIAGTFAAASLAPLRALSVSKIEKQLSTMRLASYESLGGSTAAFGRGRTLGVTSAQSDVGKTLPALELAGGFTVRMVTFEKLQHAASAYLSDDEPGSPVRGDEGFAGVEAAAQLAADLACGFAAGAMEGLVVTPLERLRVVRAEQALKTALPALQVHCGMTGVPVAVAFGSSTAFPPASSPAGSLSGATDFLRAHLGAGESGGRRLVASLWRGAGATALKQGVTCAVALGGYPLATEVLSGASKAWGLGQQNGEPSLGARLLAGAGIGGLAVVVAHPLDVVRAQRQVGLQAGLQGVPDLTGRGARGLVRGLFPAVVFGAMSWSIALTTYHALLPVMDRTERHVHHTRPFAHHYNPSMNRGLTRGGQ